MNDVKAVQPQDAATIPEWIGALAAAYGDRPCVMSDAGALSYRELDETSAVVARGLLARGVGKGTRVGLLLGNGVEWVKWWAAISRIGALCVPISTFLQPPELARVVRHADLHALVATRHFLKRDFEHLIDDAFPSLASMSGLELALGEAPYLRTIVLDDSTARWARDFAWVSAAGAADVWTEILAAAEREVFVDDDALCIYTSGQSADPKGVVHRQGTLVWKAHYLRDMFDFTDTTRTEVTMPFFWVGGLVMSLFPTMDAGGTTSCTERSSWGSVGVTGSSPAAIVTSQYSSLRKLPALGMTETFGLYSWGDEPPQDEYPIAAPMDVFEPGFEVRLVDDDGAIVPDGVPGEILGRGPTVTTRLQKVPRREAFDSDGFYRTGDRGVRHGTRINFLGRIGDMIKTSGANVSPAEVERELLAIDGVAVAHVVPLDDAKRHQVVAAAVVVEPGVELTADEIRAHLRDRLSVYKVPEIVVILDSADNVPMTPSLKVNRRALAALIAARRAQEPERTDR
jgi:acyl-CoA synthetase (AMP-forming)/AMP-acid ligase II